MTDPRPRAPQSDVAPDLPLRHVYAELRAQFLAAAEAHKGLTVLVVKRAPGLSRPSAHLRQLQGRGMVIRDDFGAGEFVSRGRQEQQQVICVGTDHAINKYMQLAATAGQALPLDRFPPGPVLETDDPGAPIGSMSTWTGFVFNQLKPPADRGRILVRTDYMDRDPWPTGGGLTVYCMEEFAVGAAELRNGLRSTYAWPARSVFAESATVIATSGLLDRSAGDEPDGPMFADFKTFRVNREDIYLSPAQARVVKVYWEAMRRGADKVHEVTALIEVGATVNRLRDLFKDKVDGKSRTHPNFDKLFTKVPDAPRCYRLNVAI